MTPLRVIICQQDGGMAKQLATCLSSQSHSVWTAATPQELHKAILRTRAQVVVVDMESAELQEVKQLHDEFNSLCIVCTHRLADEAMWTEALAAGADDVCVSSDMRGILSAALRHAQAERSVAA
jgi:DNA-binding NarL/FixJ family response regulator